MRRFLRYNGLSLVLAGFFLTTLFAGQYLTGLREYNDERRDRGEPPVSTVEYLRTAHFLEATSENWESEFFQMFVYVVATAFLFQKGSAESKDPDRKDPEPPVTVRSPWPVRRGGWMKRLYSHSLSLAFLLLFLVSFSAHAISGARLYSEEEQSSGRSGKTPWEYVRTSRFWFESFQNWQSEFLAIGSMVVLSIFLREKDSPESKPLTMAHDEHE